MRSVAEQGDAVAAPPLERFAVEKLTPIPGVARIHTSLVLSEIKASSALPISRHEGATP